MCDQDAKRPMTTHFGKQRFDSQPVSSTGSRRRRMWELPHQCHCPVVGVCFPLGVLRRLVNKTLGGQALADDYEIHVGAVAECGRRNRLSEALQRELEQRYTGAIVHFKHAKTAEAVFHLWAQAVEQGDVAGAFWAALTHSRCDDVLQETLCRDMHMLQHQAGASVRADITKLNAILKENAVLARELGKVQERCTRLLTDKSSEIERLRAQLMQIRAETISKESTIAFLRADLAALQASIPGLESRQRLQQKLDQMSTRQVALEARVSDLRQRLAVAMKAEMASAGSADATGKNAVEPHSTKTFPITLRLHHKTVLCVGGRSGNVATYRDRIERVGGRFAHHDGGMEDSQNLLNANLAAADLVICQTGCISHNAYWRVKDFCKRTGKRCVFVENPSASSLVRDLEQFSVEDSDVISAENADVKSAKELNG